MQSRCWLIQCALFFASRMFSPPERRLQPVPLSSQIVHHDYALRIVDRLLNGSKHNGIITTTTSTTTTTTINNNNNDENHVVLGPLLQCAVSSSMMVGVVSFDAFKRALQLRCQRMEGISLRVLTRLITLTCADIIIAGGGALSSSGDISSDLTTMVSETLASRLRCVFLFSKSGGRRCWVWNPQLSTYESCKTTCLVNLTLTEHGKRILAVGLNTVPKDTHFK